MIEPPPHTPVRQSASPLWGLWISFAATVVGCIHGVAHHEIALASALLAVLTLAAGIWLVAHALSVPPHPVDLPRLARLLARRPQLVHEPVAFASEPELLNG